MNDNTLEGLRTSFTGFCKKFRWKMNILRFCKIFVTWSHAITSESETQCSWVRVLKPWQSSGKLCFACLRVFFLPTGCGENFLLLVVCGECYNYTVRTNSLKLSLFKVKSNWRKSVKFYSKAIGILDKLWNNNCECGIYSEREVLGGESSLALWWFVIIQPGRFECWATSSDVSEMFRRFWSEL